ncbi:MAG: MFS transporter [Planctomycetota bacterium]|jgi:OPA family glycerol-3-phosphate transporter-like MFS transporter
MVKTVENTTLKSRRIFLWQLRAFFSMGILYLFYYFCKYNLGAVTPDIQKEFGFTSKTFGLVTTIFTLTYAGGQFINGFLGDRYGPKLIMIIGGLGGVAANVCFGLSGTLTFFIAFWAINAYFSSCGWAPGCRIMYNWFPERQWGTWMGVFNALCYTGGALVLPIVTFAIAYWGWRAAFFVAPAFLLAMTILFMLLGKNSPQDVGLKAQWEQKNVERTAKRTGAREYLIAFTNLRMNLSYLSGFGANFVRWGIITWMVKILAEPVEEGGFGLSMFVAGVITSLAHWGGAFFSLVLGVITDRVFKGIRWQTILIGFILGGLPLFYIAKGPVILDYPMGLFLLGAAMFISGGLIQAIQTPLFDLPGDILGKEMGGTGAGIMDGWMYVGASFAGVFLGWWLDSYGLTSGVMLMGFVSIASGLLAIPIQK